MGSAITFEQKGDFSKLTNMLQRSLHEISLSRLDKYGRQGVEALALNTPMDSGLTAVSWDYEIEMTKEGATITWTNSNVVNGYCNVALILQYGHVTKSGVRVEGIDYINPAIRPIFDKICKELGRDLKSL